MRLLTIMGLAGSGKTRLALELARRVGPEFDDGCCIVDLAPLTEARLTATAVAAALDVAEQPGQSLLDTLADVLECRHLLLVLDNCEHVAAEAALLIDRVLASCPSVRILAVSRIALGPSSEKRWRLPALGLSESFDLFQDRAGLVGPFHVTAANRQAIERICHRLEGLPLAIELAAARTRVLGPEQILARLGSALDGLSGAPAVPARHRTLRAAMEWSCRLLGAPERRLLEHLAVFPGDFDLEAAEAIEEGDVLEPLMELVDQSMLVTAPDATGSMRYRLPEPLREYLREGLAAHPQIADVERRHAEHFLHVARAIDGSQPLGELANRLQDFWREQHNLRKALDWALGERSALAMRLTVALARCWILGGTVAEGRNWMDRALELDLLEDDLRAWGLFYSGRMAWMSHDYERSWTDHEKALEVMRRQGDRVGVGESIFGLAITALARGETGRARALAEDGMRTHGATGYRWGLARACMLSGWTAFLEGEAERGTSLFAEALAISRADRDIHQIAYCLSGLTLIDIHRGQIHAARRKASEMMGLVRESLTTLAADSMWIWTCLLLAAAEGRDGSVMRFAGALDGRRLQASAYQADGLRIPLEQAIDRAWDRLGPVAAERLQAWGTKASVDEIVLLAWEELSTSASTPLTPRELEVAHLVRDGLTNAEIAHRLGISRRTSETHLDHIREKLGLRSRTQIAAYIAHIDGR